MMKRSIKIEHVPKHFFFGVVEFEEQKNIFLALLRRREGLQILHEQLDIVKQPASKPQQTIK